jgi:predicted O-methyltransferase YrrM
VGGKTCHALDLHGEAFFVHDGPMNEEQFVTALYKAMLSREPDNVGLSKHVTALENGKSAEQIARQFLCSAEFRSKIHRVIDLYPLDNAPPMRIDLKLSAEQERVLWIHVAEAWASLGISEPYWSVLANPEWRAANMKKTEDLHDFYNTGRKNVQRVEKWLARSQVLLPQDSTCAEYGCGVGRCTVWLAKKYARVLAFDISKAHLELAQARIEAEGLNNVQFIQVTSEYDLDKMHEIDLFYSIIVLQHNPPPLMLSILGHAFAGLKPGGMAFFQVPTYALDYSFLLEDYLTRLTNRGMEMHFVPQSAIFELALARGMQPLEVSPDRMIGNFGRWISTSFLMTRRK